MTLLNKENKISKQEARQTVLDKRQNTDNRGLIEINERIKEKLLNSDDFVYAQRIFCFVSSDQNEFDTKKIIDAAYGQGKVIFLPKLHKPSGKILRFPFLSWNHLKKNDEGFLEPQMGLDEDMSDIDLIIVPAIAVSIKGQRVGSGGGYYDRFLKNTYAPKYVLMYEYQLFNEIEYDRHDIRIDRIITERRVIDTRES
jgi:5-formyltetrahydrofolate cyclo-ligase